MGVLILLPAPRPTEPAHEILVGTRSRSGTLRARDLDFLTAAWRNLYCSLRIAWRTDLGAERACRNCSAGRVLEPSSPGYWQLGVSAPANTLLAELERYRIGRRHRYRCDARFACHRKQMDAL